MPSFFGESRYGESSCSLAVTLGTLKALVIAPSEEGDDLSAISKATRSWGLFGGGAEGGVTTTSSCATIGRRAAGLTREGKASARHAELADSARRRQGRDRRCAGAASTEEDALIRFFTTSSLRGACHRGEGGVDGDGVGVLPEAVEARRARPAAGGARGGEKRVEGRWFILRPGRSATSGRLCDGDDARAFAGELATLELYYSPFAALRAAAASGIMWRET